LAALSLWFAVSEVEAAGSAFSPPSSLYVHIPFCSSKCRYCDFFSLPTGKVAFSSMAALVDATLVRAHKLAERFAASKFSTIYIGGGTPTALPLPLLDRLLFALAPLADTVCEWTIEANPESLAPEHIDLFLRYGLTRLSLGVQSLDDVELNILGRAHNAKTALSALRLCVDSGLSVSADLIAGISARSSIEGLAASAEVLLDLGIKHLSIYDLTLEEGTPLARSVESGELRLPDADRVFSAWNHARRVLDRAGFRRYEVSNFSAPGSECRHNLSYWRLVSYIGVGPGAVSTLVGKAGGGGVSLRIEECRDMLSYFDPFVASNEARIAAADSAFEMIMMSFRTIFGLDLDDFASRFDREAEELLEKTLTVWNGHIRTGEILPTDSEVRRRMALDEGGMDLLNRFLGDCLDEIRGKMRLFQKSDDLKSDDL
jgi:oxygen-independent coproporphyrinogen-3 oxidase